MVLSALSGNEIFCLAQKGWTTGNIVLGSSVHSLGVVKNFGAGMRSFIGGEVESVTDLISEGRKSALRRLEIEAKRQGVNGITGVTSDLRKLNSSLYEFLTIGSAIQGKDFDGDFFSTACSGQDLYCHLDAGYAPRSFVMGNIAYAIGARRFFASRMQRTLGGEIKELTETVNRIRHLALYRLEKEAMESGANAIVDVSTFLLPFGLGMRQMLMIGSASFNAYIVTGERPVTSNLSGEELWNLSSMGFQPVRLLFATSIVALGIAGGLRTFFNSLRAGEVQGISRLVYDARQRCLSRIQEEADSLGTDGVIGIKLFVHEHGGGLAEVIAIGTAIRRNENCKVQSRVLLPQAIIRDRPTFFDTVQGKEQHLLRKYS